VKTYFIVEEVVEVGGQLLPECAEERLAEKGLNAVKVIL